MMKIPACRSIYQELLSDGKRTAGKRLFFGWAYICSETAYYGRGMALSLANDLRSAGNSTRRSEGNRTCGAKPAAPKSYAKSKSVLQ